MFLSPLRGSAWWWRPGPGADALEVKQVKFVWSAAIYRRFLVVNSVRFRSLLNLAKSGDKSPHSKKSPILRLDLTSFPMDLRGKPVSQGAEFVDSFAEERHMAHRRLGDLGDVRLLNRLQFF